MPSKTPKVSRLAADIRMQGTRPEVCSQVGMTAMVHQDGRIEGLLGFGLSLGIYFFFRGFQVFREYRVVGDTPESPVRSVPMGLVRVHGKAAGAALLRSPLSRQPSFFYKVDIEKWENNGRRSEWRHYRTDLQGVHFDLVDPTGSITIDPLGAEYDLLQSGKREVSSGLGWGPGSVRGPDVEGKIPAPATDHEVLCYIGTAGSNSASSLALNRGAAWLQQALAGTGQTNDSEPQVSQATLVATSFMPGNVRVAANALRAGNGESEMLSGPQASVSVQERVIDLAGSPFAEPASGRYRLTEYCILPGHYYDVTGTCTESPVPAEEQTQKLITKGQNEPAFLISWRTPQGVETTLRDRAAWMIFGGAALAIASLGFLLARLGYL